MAFDRNFSVGRQGKTWHLSPMKKLSATEIRGLPKVELHRHLDCSMRWSTLLELAPQVGIELPQNPEACRDLFLVTSPMKDLDSVLKKFLRAQKVLASEEILERLAFEACEDAFNDGILLLELRYAPTFIQDGHPNLDFKRIHRALCKGLEKARRQFPLAVGLIGIVQRIKSLEVAQSVVEFVFDHRDSFIGVDLADNEDGFDAKKFAPLFTKARQEGLRVTIHSGETPHPQAPQWVRDSIEILGAERIGHGVQIVRDPTLVEFVRQKKIPLEVCLHSNDLTQAFPSPSQHSLRQLWSAGVLCTLNADDPGIFASTLTDDYLLAQEHHGFGLPDFTRANDIAAAVSFLPPEEKARVWPRPLMKE